MPMTLLHYVEIENSKQINHTLHCNEKARTLCQVTYAYDGFRCHFMFQQRRVIICRSF